LLVPVAAIGTLGPVQEPDLYWHIRMGADILEHGRFTGDPIWTYGPSLVWATTQAGSELLLYGIHGLGSWAGILVFRVVMAALVMVSLLLATTAVVRSRPTIARDRSVALVAVVGVSVVVQFVQERPQTLSLLILPWIGVMLLRTMYADRWPSWWAVGLLVMVWSWFHGAAILVGPLLVAATLIHALGAAGLRWLPVLLHSLRRGWPVILAALAAPFVGPLGLSYYAQASKIQDAASQRIVEWSPPAADSFYLWMAFALIGAWAFCLVRLAAGSGRIWRTFRMDMLFVVSTGLVMTTAGRYIGIGVLLMAPLVARRIAQAWNRPPVRLERSRPRVAGAVVAIVTVVAVVLTGLVAAHVRPVGTDSPLLIWEGLAAQPDGRRAFVDYALGGQGGLLGEVVVSIDGRADRYGGAGIDANTAITDGKPGWERGLAAYPGTTDVVTAIDGGLADRLGAAGWRQVCTDGGYVWLAAPGVAGECPSEAAQ
jgi:hypothetical protein